jgi:hypothetical protein
MNKYEHESDKRVGTGKIGRDAGKRGAKNQIAMQIIEYRFCGDNKILINTSRAPFFDSYLTEQKLGTIDKDDVHVRQINVNDFIDGITRVAVLNIINSACNSITSLDGRPEPAEIKNSVKATMMRTYDSTVEKMDGWSVYSTFKLELTAEMNSHSSAGSFGSEIDMNKFMDPYFGFTYRLVDCMAEAAARNVHILNEYSQYGRVEIRLEDGLIHMYDNTGHLVTNNVLSRYLMHTQIIDDDTDADTETTEGTGVHVVRQLTSLVCDIPLIEISFDSRLSDLANNFSLKYKQLLANTEIKTFEAETGEDAHGMLN